MEASDAVASPSTVGVKRLRDEGPEEEEAARREDAIREFITRIEPHWLTRSNVERRNVDSLSHAEFVERYEQPGVPVILTGMVGKWAASTDWTRARLLERFGDVEFRVSANVDMTLKDYLAYADKVGTFGHREERPLYLFDKDFCRKCPEMAGEFDIPAYFSQDLMSVLGERRPDYKWLIIGPRGAGSSFHVDPNENFAWNATISGRKKWVFYPPDCPPPTTAEDEHQLCLPRWFREHYDGDEHAGVRLECITGAGECMYVPRGWWHCVLNLELCVAITHNVVTQNNLQPALDFLEHTATCAPGEGCRGAEKFNLSGDVPATVIFPYPSLTQTNARPAACSAVRAEGGEKPGVAGGADEAAEQIDCTCSRKRRELCRELRAGLERDHPELIAELISKRESRAAAAPSALASVVKADAGQSSFSFGF